MAQDFQAGIVDTGAGITAELQMFQLRHAGQEMKALLRHFAATTDAKVGNVIERGDLPQHAVRHEAVGFEGSDPMLAGNGDQVVPFGAVQSATRGDGKVLEVVKGARSRLALGCCFQQGFPVAEPGVLREQELRFAELQVVLFHLRRALAKGVNTPPDFGLDVTEGEGTVVISVEAIERGGVPFVGIHPVLGQRVELGWSGGQCTVRVLRFM